MNDTVNNAPTLTPEQMKAIEDEMMFRSRVFESTRAEQLAQAMNAAAENRADLAVANRRIGALQNQLAAAHQALATRALADDEARKLAARQAADKQAQGIEDAHDKLLGNAADSAIDTLRESAGLPPKPH